MSLETEQVQSAVKTAVTSHFKPKLFDSFLPFFFFYDMRHSWSIAGCRSSYLSSEAVSRSTGRPAGTFAWCSRWCCACQCRCSGWPSPPSGGPQISERRGARWVGRTAPLSKQRDKLATGQTLPSKLLCLIICCCFAWKTERWCEIFSAKPGGTYTGTWAATDPRCRPLGRRWSWCQAGNSQGYSGMKRSSGSCNDVARWAVPAWRCYQHDPALCSSQLEENGAGGERRRKWNDEPEIKEDQYS